MVARGEATYDITRLLTNYRPTISTRQQSKLLTAGQEITDVPAQVNLQVTARGLLLEIATSGTRTPITSGGAITLTRVSCATLLSTVLCFIFPKLLLRKNRLPIDYILLPRQRPTPLSNGCLLYTSPSPRDLSTSRMPSSA